MKKTILLIFLIALSFTGKAQFAVNYYYDGNTIGISTNPEKGTLAWIPRENITVYIFRLEPFTSGHFNAYFCYKLISDGKASLYLGNGFGLPISCDKVGTININIPIAIQLNPFNQLPKLYITADYTPMFSVSNEMETLNTLSVGFKFVFSK